MLPGFLLLAKIFVYLIASWFLIHLFAVFGIFAAASLFIWSVFDPKQAICLVCRFQRTGKACRFCKKVLNSGMSHGRVTFLAIMVNSILILALTLFSAGIVYLESRVLLRLGFSPTSKSVSFVIPSHGQYRLNEVFPTKIEIIGIEQPINLVQADLSFDPNILEVTDVSTKNSFANIFIQKEIDNNNGYVRLTGGLPNPGFSSERGEFFTVFFKGKTPGPVKVEFLPTSMVLANDSRGSNVMKDLASASYLILAEEYEELKSDKQEAGMQTLILGAEEENTQMIFYEEEKVLGAEVSKEIKAKKKFEVGTVFLDGIGQIDNFILNLWSSFL